MRCKYCGGVITGQHASFMGSYWPNPTLMTEPEGSYCENAPPTPDNNGIYYRFHEAYTFKEYYQCVANTVKR